MDDKIICTFVTLEVIAIVILISSRCIIFVN